MTRILLRITKTAASPAARIEAGNWHSFSVGAANNTSLPVDYEMDGWLERPVEIMQRLEVFRLRRNGVAVPGVFRSTPIRSLFALTENSIYRLELLPPDQMPPLTFTFHQSPWPSADETH